MKIVIRRGDLGMNQEIVLEFIKQINEQHVEKILELMTDEHSFIDAHGVVIKGKDSLRDAWKGYFEWFPDYKIEVRQIMERENTVGIFGFASGTYRDMRTDYNENYWGIPASWKAIVENGKIKEWQVYADTKIVFDIMRRVDKTQE
jgi:hypothetical protein